MKRGLVQDELYRRERVNVFTPSVLAQWQEEENDRAFLAWCRAEEVRELLPDTTEPVKKNWYHMLTSVLP